MTSALHIVLGDRQALDVAGVFVDGKLNRFAVSMLSYGFYGDVMKVSGRKPEGKGVGPHHTNPCLSRTPGSIPRISVGWGPCGTTLRERANTSARRTTLPSMWSTAQYVSSVEMVYNPAWPWLYQGYVQ